MSLIQFIFLDFIYNVNIRKPNERQTAEQTGRQTDGEREIDTFLLSVLNHSAIGLNVFEMSIPQVI